MRRSAEGDPRDVVVGLWRELRRGDFPVVDGYVFEGRSFVVARRRPGVAACWNELTARERQVVARAALGHSNKVIACELGLATSTVGVHLANARQKLGAKTRAALIGAFLATREGEPSSELTMARTLARASRCAMPQQVADCPCRLHGR